MGAKRWNPARAALLLCLFAAVPLGQAQPATAETTIRVEPYALDGAKIVTPWGTYISIVEGNTVWVGTEKEYQDRWARAVFRDAGAREFCALGVQHCNKFIEADLPRVFTDRDEIASISVSAAFASDPSAHRPRLQKGSEYVEVVWLQRGRERVRAVISDKSTGKTYGAHDCGVDDAFHHCDFTMPRAALTHPAIIAFVTPNQRPGVLPAESIVRLAYNSIASTVRDLERSHITRDPTDRDSDTYKDLASLRALDPTIPLWPTASDTVGPTGSK